MQVLAKQLAAVSHAIAKNDARYYLEGVHFSRVEKDLRVVGGDTTKVQATNGHILLELETDQPYFDVDAPSDYIIQFTTDQLRDIRKKSNADKPVTFSGLDDPLTSKMELGGTVSMVQVLDGRFPDTAKVWPKETNGALGSGMGFNADYIATMTKAGKAAEPYADVTGMRFVFSDAAAIVEYPGLDLKGLIMPMRV